MQELYSGEGDLMEIKRIVSAIVGFAQSGIGVISAVWTVLLFLGLFDVQALFEVPPELMPFYLLILGLFSLFSIISGGFLIWELGR